MGKKERTRKQSVEKKLGPSTSPPESFFVMQHGGLPSAALDFLQTERETYARKWSQSNAARFEADGHYAWMAGFLNGCEKVLEIGTGDGRGTLALLNAKHTVISVDENPIILESAQARLQVAGKNVVCQARGKVSISRRGYDIRYKYPQASPITDGALLLEGDVQSDSKLLKWLEDNAPFDAMTCWLIGTHQARTYNEAFDHVFNINDVAGYRQSVQGVIYKLADKLLRPGGLLQIVDRGLPLGNQAARTSVILHHAEQAKLTTMDFYSLDDRHYEEAKVENEDENKVTMIATMSDRGSVPKLHKFSLISIISKKPETRSKFI